MSDKLDFSGFETPVEAEAIASPPKQRPKPTPAAAPRKRKPKTAPSRRKRRINVSLEPAISRHAVNEAAARRLTLSDLLRSAYRDAAGRFDASWFESNPEPFSHRSSAATGRIVHMLYLTDEEVGILDGLAAEYNSSRSGVVSVLLTASSN